MRDLYSILGVSRSASSDEVKKAYRSKAKEYHPDRNKDDPKVAEIFKEVNAAYAILGDKDQRSRYDRGEINDTGEETGRAGGPGTYGPGAGFGGSRRSDFGSGFSFDDAEDLMNDFWRFSGRPGSQSQSKGRSGSSGQSRSRASEGIRRRGIDINYDIMIGFEDSITGGSRRLKLTDGRTLDVKVPAGIQDGQVVRLSGQGGPGFGGAPKGDALIEVRVADHPYFRREGMDIHLELPIALDEAILGRDIEVPTPRGRVMVRIPKNTSTGRRLRLRGKGVKKGAKSGHMYVTLKVMLPNERSLDLEKAIKNWSENEGAHVGKHIRKSAGLD